MVGNDVAHARAWDVTGMPTLKPDGSNFAKWHFLAQAAAEGNGAKHLLTREPEPGNNYEVALAGRFKAFLAFTTDSSFLPIIQSMSTLQA